MDKVRIKDILDNNISEEQYEQAHAMEDVESKTDLKGMCVECEDMPASIFCENCEEDFCSVCFDNIHRKGKRSQHNVVKLKAEEPVDIAEEEILESGKVLSPSIEADSEPDEHHSVEWIAERAKFIPLRLTHNERKLLRLLVGALKVSEYTDKIDILSYRSKTSRVFEQLKEMCAVLSGLMVAFDYKEGQKLVIEREFQDNALFFQTLFELGRRYKIMNPEKMRSEYGKLLYMLQDASSIEVQELLEFNLNQPVQTVWRYLEARDGLGVLQDSLLPIATMEIRGEHKKRNDVQKLIHKKEKAIELIAKRYQNAHLSAEQIRQALYSIGDNHAFLRFARDPVDKIIHYLQHFFSSSSAESHDYSLAICTGHEGARLTHSHCRQYQYVLQSLTLWREITHDMFRLWILAEQDLLDPANYYRLMNTGQGLNRCQPCPRISKAMYHILHIAQKRLGDWVGSSVVHLGDHNVPNALMFIDKYTQVARILRPVAHTISEIENLPRNPKLAHLVNTVYGGVENAQKTILTDFFRHAFDGSGADNFFSAGSCIDGRLTSAWNWCSSLEKKPYFPLFLLSGFVGFDGDFQE